MMTKNCEQHLLPLYFKQLALVQFLTNQGFYSLEEEVDFSNMTQDGCAYTEKLREWLILTEHEATERVYHIIKETLWTCRTGILMNYFECDYLLSDNENIAFYNSIRCIQEKMCESCNPVIISLLGKNLDDFIGHCASNEGLAHFLASYDGKEYEFNDYLIYRLN